MAMGLKGGGSSGHTMPGGQSVSASKHREAGVDLRNDIVESIREIARRDGVRRVVLFGSRARGDNRERSDIDLAVAGGNVAAFALDVDEETPTLLMYDVVDLDGPVQPELLEEIAKDGVVLYEQPKA